MIPVVGKSKLCTEGSSSLYYYTTVLCHLKATIVETASASDLQPAKKLKHHLDREFIGRSGLFDIMVGKWSKLNLVVFGNS